MPNHICQIIRVALIRGVADAQLVDGSIRSRVALVDGHRVHWESDPGVADWGLWAGLGTLQFFTLGLTAHTIEWSRNHGHRDRPHPGTGDERGVGAPGDDTADGIGELVGSPRLRILFPRKANQLSDFRGVDQPLGLSLLRLVDVLTLGRGRDLVVVVDRHPHAWCIALDFPYHG